MLKTLFVCLLLCSCYIETQAQVGVAVIGSSKVGTDSLTIFTTGKTTTPSCAFPGGCQSGCPVYTFTGSGNWDEPNNWKDLLVPPVSLPACFEIFIDPAGSTECILNIPRQIINSGASITVAAGKKFRLPDELNVR